MKKNKIIILLAVISCLSLFLLYNISIRPYDIEIMSGSGETKKIERLPFFEESKTSNNKYIFKGKINLPSLFPKFLHITLDNCLEYIKINGANVPIQSSNNDLCNYREGFNIEAGNYFRKGPNEFEIKVKRRRIFLSSKSFQLLPIRTELFRRDSTEEPNILS